MEQPSDSVTKAVPTSSTPAVPPHAIKTFANNPVPDLVQRSHIIVCALPAPNNPFFGPFRASYERKTFWTACASCKNEKKLSMEYLDCNISCLQCNETFKAAEVSRRRNQHTTSTENVHSRKIVTSPGTLGEQSKMTPTAKTPLPKRVKRENVQSGKIVTSSATLLEPSKMMLTARTPLPKRVKRDIDVTLGKHSYKLQGLFNKDEIKRLLISKGRNKIIERMNVM